MTASGLPDHVEAVVEGPVSGQLAVGKYITQLNVEAGAVVNWLPPSQQPVPRARPRPVLRRPRPMRGLLGRQNECASVSHELESGVPVEVYGRLGVGKTSVLRHLAHHAQAAFAEQAILYFFARGQPRIDLLQYIFETLYETDVPLKLTDSQVMHYLHDTEALIALDDIDLPRDEVVALVDAAPNLTFLLASETRHLWGEGVGIALRGLDQDAALALFERGLARPLTTAERPHAVKLCSALEGHPLSIVQLAELVQQAAYSLADLAASVPAHASSTDAVARLAMDALSPREKQVLGVLAVMTGVPIHRAHVAAVAGVPDASSELRSLQQRRLAEAHSPGYSLTISSGPELEQALHVSGLLERTLDYLTTWAEQHAGEPQMLAEDATTISAVTLRAAQRAHWPQVFRLARAVEETLVMTRRWGAWGAVLQVGLEAALTTGDLREQGWFRHQLGSRALCLEDISAAENNLAQALEIRESLGDRRGAAATRHNLNVLRGGPPPPPRGPSSDDRGPPSPARPGLKALVLAGLAILVLTVGGATAWGVTRQPPPSSTPVATAAAIPSLTATPNSTATPSAKSTATRSAKSTATPSAKPTATASTSSTPSASAAVVPPPTGLVATVRSCRIDLAWTAPPNVSIAGYKIYRDGSPLPGQVSGTSYSDAGIYNGTYTYAVRAVDAAGNSSSPSNPASVQACIT